MKRKFLFPMTAILPAAVLAIAAHGQVAPPTGTAPAEKADRTFKWEASAGYGYTSLNQVNQSRAGLQGVEASVARDFGKHFGVIADGAYYKYALKSGNPGNPAVDVVLFGPVVRADLYSHLSGFIRGLVGGEHTAGNGETPNLSVAGGFGGGMEWQFTPRISLRASGDDIYSSFVEDPLHLGYSPHLRSNSRASFGVVYRF